MPKRSAMPVAHYENFPVASFLLPARLRRPVEAIYRFARGADDIADEGEATDGERLQGLAAYREELDRIAAGQAPADASFAELAQVIDEWRLPQQLFRDLLDAFAQDVVKKRYDDYPQLLDYCRRSANPVGRLLVHQLPGRLGWEIRLTVQGGLAILDQIDRVRGDVFAHRPLLRRGDWLRMAGRALFM